MDISSGIVDFGTTCPGALMKKLQADVPDQVSQIKELRLSFSKDMVHYMCPIGADDIENVTSFISSIKAINKLTVLNYEADASALWGAVHHHADSLESLAIHSPPHFHKSNVWDATMLASQWHGFTLLRSVELDVSLEEAEACLAAGDHKLPPALELVGKLEHLESLLVNVNLSDEPSAFADRHTWNVMGSISFPPPNAQPCAQLAELFFKKTRLLSPESKLKDLELRFPRRCWDDRAQFWTTAHSIKVKAVGTGVEVEHGQDWYSYLPDAPGVGKLRPLIEENRKAQALYS